MSFCWISLFNIAENDCIVGLQVVTVGVVGGSDLVKITEQLGKTGTSNCHMGCFWERLIGFLY